MTDTPKNDPLFPDRPRQEALFSAHEKYQNGSTWEEGAENYFRPDRELEGAIGTFVKECLKAFITNLRPKLSDDGKEVLVMDLYNDNEEPILKIDLQQLREELEERRAIYSSQRWAMKYERDGMIVWGYDE